MFAHGAQAAAGRAGGREVLIFIFQSGGPSQHETFDPKPDAPDTIRGDYGTTATRLAGIRFCEYLPRLAQRADRFSIVRTMHQTADRQFRNEHNSCAYLLHTGSTELPAGDSNASIVAPRAGRFEWPSIGSMIAFAAPPEKGVALPAMIELPRGSQMKYPGRGSGPLGSRYDRWGVDLAPPCRSPDPAGSCPNCFSHDDPNDAARAAGKGPKAWWDNSSCRDPAFACRSRRAVPVSCRSSRTGFAARRLDHLGRSLERADRSGNSTHGTPTGTRHATPRRGHPPGGEIPSTCAEPDRIPISTVAGVGPGFLLARRSWKRACMVQVNLRGWDTHQTRFAISGQVAPSLDGA